MALPERPTPDETDIVTADIDTDVPLPLSVRQVPNAMNFLQARP